MTQRDPQDDDRSNGTTKETFGGSEIVRQPETASTAMAAAAKASIEARYIMALQRPRNIDDVRVKLLKECDRPGFAEAALYRKPVGKKKNPETGEWEQQYVEGLSVRFAEAALRSMTNMHSSAASIYDDHEKAISNVSITDLEANVTIDFDVTIEKTVERKELKKNQKPLAVRTNSYGDTVYIVNATDDDVLNKKNALISKARRNCMAQLVPGDIQDECEARCRETQKKADAKDPDAARKRLFDNFASIGVMPGQIMDYLGHSSALHPNELMQLRAIFAAIREGDTTWAAVMDAKQGNVTSDGEVKPKTQAQKAVDAVVEKQKQKNAEKAAKEAAEKAAKAAAEKAAAEAATTPATPAENPAEAAASTAKPPREPGVD